MMVNQNNIVNQNKELIEEIEKLKGKIKTLKSRKKYGIVWEDEKEPEKIVSDCQHKIPILKEIDTKKIIIDKTKSTNILIEGDNYHALSVLNYTHKEKIDIIYIDPPYNTGKANEWKYNDRYIDENDVYKHSKWISFMNNRLKLAKNLLNNKGVIFISINNIELAQLKLLCDEIFGDENLVAIFPRLTVKGGKTQSLFSTNNCDYLICYAKNKDNLNFNKLRVQDDPAFKYSDKYVESRGMYHTKQALDTQSLKYHKSADYIIKIKDEKYYPGKTSEKNGYIWTWSFKKFQFAYKNDFVEFKNGRIWPKKYLKAQIDKKNGEYYIKSVDREKNYSQIIFIDNKYSNPNATKLLKNMQINFDYPKPISLIKTILKMVYYKDNIIVLDFFAGSGTTGHAILELNKEDNKNRRFILCTNNENNICTEVCYPRIEKVIKGYKNLEGKYVESLGGNLRYFKTELLDVDHIYHVSDDQKIKLTYKAGEMIALKEDTFAEVEKNDWWQIFENGIKYTAIYFKEDKSRLNELIKKLGEVKGKVTLYIFSWGKDEYKSEFIEYKNIKVDDIPEPIIDVYQQINRLS